jgi:hypothetical protein
MAGTISSVSYGGISDIYSNSYIIDIRWNDGNQGGTFGILARYIDVWIDEPISNPPTKNVNITSVSEDVGVSYAEPMIFIGTNLKFKLRELYNTPYSYGLSSPEYPTNGQGYTLNMNLFIHFEAEDSVSQTLINKANVSQSFNNRGFNELKYIRYDELTAYGYFMEHGCVTLENIRDIHEYGVLSTSDPLVFSTYTVFTVSNDLSNKGWPYTFIPENPTLFSYTHYDSDDVLFSIWFNGNNIYITLFGTSYNTGIYFDIDRERYYRKVLLLYCSIKRLSATTYAITLKIWNIMFDGTTYSNAFIDWNGNDLTFTQSRTYTSNQRYDYHVGGDGQNYNEETDMSAVYSLSGVVFEHKLYEGIIDNDIDRIARKKFAEYSDTLPVADTVAWDNWSTGLSLRFNVTFGAASKDNGYTVGHRRVVLISTTYPDDDPIYSENITSEGTYSIERARWNWYKYHIETMFAEPFNYTASSNPKSSNFFVGGD